MILQWLRRRQEARRLAQADAEALIRDYGAAAYREARERERDVILQDGTTHAGRTGRPSLLHGRVSADTHGRVPAAVTGGRDGV